MITLNDDSLYYLLVNFLNDRLGFLRTVSKDFKDFIDSFFRNPCITHRGIFAESETLLNYAKIHKIKITNKSAINKIESLHVPPSALFESPFAPLRWDLVASYLNTKPGQKCIELMELLLDDPFFRFQLKKNSIWFHTIQYLLFASDDVLFEWLCKNHSKIYDHYLSDSSMKGGDDELIYRLARIQWHPFSPGLLNIDGKKYIRTLITFPHLIHYGIDVALSIEDIQLLLMESFEIAKIPDRFFIDVFFVDPFCIKMIKNVNKVIKALQNRDIISLSNEIKLFDSLHLPKAKSIDQKTFLSYLEYAIVNCWKEGIEFFCCRCDIESLTFFSSFDNSNISYSHQFVLFVERKLKESNSLFRFHVFLTRSKNVENIRYIIIQMKKSLCQMKTKYKVYVPEHLKHLIAFLEMDAFSLINQRASSLFNKLTAHLKDKIFLIEENLRKEFQCLLFLLIVKSFNQRHNFNPKSKLFPFWDQLFCSEFSHHRKMFSEECLGCIFVVYEKSNINLINNYPLTFRDKNCEQFYPFLQVNNILDRNRNEFSIEFFEFFKDIILNHNNRNFVQKCFHLGYFDDDLLNWFKKNNVQPHDYCAILCYYALREKIDLFLIDYGQNLIIGYNFFIAKWNDMPLSVLQFVEFQEKGIIKDNLLPLICHRENISPFKFAI